MTSRHQVAKAKAIESLALLDRALGHLDADPLATDRWVRLDAVAKRFEVAFEYVWKAFKGAAEWQGTEAPGPRPAILAAGQYGWITNRDEWVEYLESRNAAIHDYFGLSPEEYGEIARRFLFAAKAAVAAIQDDSP